MCWLRTQIKLLNPPDTPPVPLSKYTHESRVIMALLSLNSFSERDPSMVCWRQVRSDQCSSAQGLPAAITNAGIINQLVNE